MEYGIERFKAATVAEAEMLARLEVPHICLSNLLVGPNLQRFVQLVKAYPESQFWTLADDLGIWSELDATLAAAGVQALVLVDVNLGLDRTGVPVGEVGAFTRAGRAYEHASFAGYHCYDGNVRQADPEERLAVVRGSREQLVEALADELAEHAEKLVLIVGGSPSFPSHVELVDKYYSPGTIFINDYGYYSSFPDIACPPAAAVLTRVISRPGPGLFTLDAGSKAVSADKPMEQRGYLVGWGERVRPLRQNEEHWVWEMTDPRDTPPAVGDTLYVIPGHICPTSALYRHAEVVKGGRLHASWPITARNRRIHI